MIFLSIGSNIGDRATSLTQAATALNLKVIKSSSIYETQPVDYLDQPWFLNQVIQVESDLKPIDLLQHCQHIESAMGRIRKTRKGPRTIDIDILYYNDLVHHQSGLAIPHPEIPFRRFVLVPLAEIAADFKHPILQRSQAELLEICPDISIVRKFETP